MVQRHAFTERIESVLASHFGKDAKKVFEQSPLIGYLNQKTKSANRGSKARGAFANHYALFVLIEDYINKGYAPGEALHGKYGDYEGAKFSDLFKRQRELPFGQKLQNHALNARLNDEFRKYYPTLERTPIVRDVENQRYWIHEGLLTVTVGDGKAQRELNLARAVIDIINAYVETKKEAFGVFLDACRQLGELSADDSEKVVEFVKGQLQPNVDARIFEIVSFAILRAFYGEKHVFWGWTRDSITEEALTLFKTGRTNANDGGIDFVMRPLGRFFQVTETVDVHKYFLDIDKIQRFPLTFVVKTTDSVEAILESIKGQALEKYKIRAVVDGYMRAIEEVINIPILLGRIAEVVKVKKVLDVMNEIVLQSKVEFNYEDLGEEDEESGPLPVGGSPA